MVDSRFTEKVDSRPDIVDSITGFVDIFLKVLTTGNTAPAKLGINLQILSILRINFVLPHLFLFTCLLMHGIRSLQPDAVVWASAVVEEDEALYLLLCFLIGLKTPFLTVYALALNHAVDAFCKGVVGGFVVLCHRDLYAVLLQFLNVEVTAVLDAAVRVVDKSAEVTSAGLFYGHAEGFECEDSRKGFCKAPANDLM